jgi:hypothetical protein
VFSSVVRREGESLMARGLAGLVQVAVVALLVAACAAAPLPKQPWVSDATPAATARVPYVGEAGQQAYREYLSLPLPRAFAVSASGHYAMASGTVTGDLDVSTDPKLRALDDCRRRARAVCWLYAIDGAVVLSVKPVPTGAGAE